MFGEMESFDFRFSVCLLALRALRTRTRMRAGRFNPGQGETACFATDAYEMGAIGFIYS